MTEKAKAERGVYVDRDSGTVRAVTATGRDLMMRFAENGDLEAVIADAWRELDTRDPSPREKEDGLASRGVYEQPFLVKGCREFVAVSSTGEMIAARLVRRGGSSARAERELWEDLDELDPVPSGQRRPALHLVQ